MHVSQVWFDANRYDVLHCYCQNNKNPRFHLNKVKYILQDEKKVNMPSSYMIVISTVIKRLSVVLLQSLNGNIQNHVCWHCAISRELYNFSDIFFI